MNAAELSIDLQRNEIAACVKADGRDRERTRISRDKGGAALSAWLEGVVDGKVYARIQIAGADDMQLALDLARRMASAGHTVSVENICRFSPAKSINQSENQFT
jgi:hypothetical protein